jgi:hypothetical protein
VDRSKCDTNCSAVKRTPLALNIDITSLSGSDTGFVHSSGKNATGQYKVRFMGRFLGVIFQKSNAERTNERMKERGKDAKKKAQT